MIAQMIAANLPESSFYENEITTLNEARRKQQKKIRTTV